MNDPLQTEAGTASQLAAAVARAGAAGHLDELRAGAGADGLAPHWSAFFSHLGPEGFADLDRRGQAVVRQLRDNGVTYKVYADRDATQRPWSLDLFPQIIPAADWAQIEAGVLQRTRLLDRVLADIYGERRLLHEGLLPAALVLGHPGYLRAMQGVTPPGGTWLHVAAFDIAHGPDGRWWLVSDRTQAPSGLGYLLENRLAIARQFPGAFSALKVRRLGASYRALMQGLRALSPRGPEARIALLTPGPYNETHFEHAYLARYLGLTLVEGSDLTVRDRRVYLKTLNGLEPLDVLIKRVDDEWLDPLELRADSALGVPGLMQAVRAGHLLLANAPGSAPLESTAIQGFLPAICQRLLGEPLRLPSLPTWWCGEAASLQVALPRLRDCVIKGSWPGQESVIGPRLDDDELARLARRIVQDPDRHALQAYLPLSQQPAWRDGAIAPRATMLRVFALADGPGSWRVLPGGLVRLAPRGEAIASMQRGGSSADCWVLSEGDIDDGSLPRSAPGTLSLAQRKRLVTSRSAENLFWLGRYTERAEHSARLARIALRALQGDEANPNALLRWLAAAARAQGLVTHDAPDPCHALRAFERELIARLGAASGSASVGHNLRALRQSAGQVRERLSQELRAHIERVDDEFGAGVPALNADSEQGPQQAIERLDAAAERLTTITGAQTDRMMRDDGWRMLSIGRHIERLHALAQALALAIDSGCLQDELGFEAVLALFDSTITFHAQYQQRRDLVALVDLLVINRDNPRSLGWVLSTLRSRLAKLPRSDRLAARLPDPDGWDLDELAGDGLMPLLRQLERASFELSDALAQRYFSHADRINRSLMT